MLRWTDSLDEALIHKSVRKHGVENTQGFQLWLAFEFIGNPAVGELSQTVGLEIEEFSMASESSIDQMVHA